MIGTPLSSSGVVQVSLMHVLDALSNFGAPGGPESTQETRHIDQLSILLCKLTCIYYSMLSSWQKLAVKYCWIFR